MKKTTKSIWPVKLLLFIQIAFTAVMDKLLLDKLAVATEPAFRNEHGIETTLVMFLSLIMIFTSITLMFDINTVKIILAVISTIIFTISAIGLNMITLYVPAVALVLALVAYFVITKEPDTAKQQA